MIVALADLPYFEPEEVNFLLSILDPINDDVTILDVAGENNNVVPIKPKRNLKRDLKRDLKRCRDEPLVPSTPIKRLKGVETNDTLIAN